MSPDRVTLGIGVALVIVAVLAVLGVAFLPSSTGSRLEAIRANVDALRAAELDHLEAFGHPLPAAASPRAPRGLTAEPVPWVPSEGFRALAWAPSDRDAVFASYAVTVEGSEFVVTARCDLDGDGVLAEVQATHETAAVLRSPSAVR
ncbi:MAG: hypothetical protein AAGA48_13165 [Myxococcota bacterium]